VADAEEKARRERIIFQLFAEGGGSAYAISRESSGACAGYSLRGERRRPRCVRELGEVVHPPLIERTNQSHALNHRFARNTRRCRRRLGGASSRTSGALRLFSSHSPLRPERGYVPSPLFLTSSSNAPGNSSMAKIPVWNIPTLEDVVLEMEVQRAGSGSAGLYTAEMTETVDQTLALLRKKFSRPYTATAPLELVAYYISQPPSDRGGWLESVAAFITANLASSPFRRVWLFDHFTRNIPLVLPPR
jgi:hypothetical protein